MTNYSIRNSLGIRRRPFALILIVLCELAITYPGHGQSGTSSALTGVVTDASHAVVAGSSVTARDVNTGAVRTGQTDSSGRFLFAQLNPGTYQIDVKAPGFAIQRSPSIVVAVGQTATVNFTLAPAGNSQTIEVNAPTAQMDLENPNTSATLDAKTIANLPNPGQDLEADGDFTINDVLSPEPRDPCTTPVLLIRTTGGTHPWFAAGIPD